MKFIDLTGQKFNKLTVLKRDGYKGEDILWLCLCECGKTNRVIGYALTSGGTKSCGCLKNKKGAILKNEMKQAIKLRQTEKLSFVKIAKILGVGKSSVGNWCGLIEPKKKKGPVWTNAEIEILKKYYPSKGSKYCAQLINRSIPCIIQKAQVVGLKSIVTSWGPRKIVIQKISKNRVVSCCRQHGNTIHSYKDNIIIACMICTNIKAKKQRLSNLDRNRKYDRIWKKNKIKNDPVYALASRLRNQIRGAINKYVKRQCITTKGSFRLLAYKPLDLFYHLENIKQKQNSSCPICKQLYEKTGFNIEHIIPLKTAKTEKEIIDLFALSNLSLMCPNCNFSKGKKDYKTWIKEKKYVIK